MAFLRKSLRQHSIKINYTKKKQLEKLKKQSLLKIKQQYPHVLVSDTLHNKIAYMLRPESPDEIVSNGGFTANSELWLAHINGDNLNTCNSNGTICLSLLPEVTVLFLSNRSIETKDHYLYAIPLHDKMVLLGSKWRQIASPGALPLPDVWRCRKILKDEHDKVTFGPLLGNGCDSIVQKGEKYEAYLNPYLRKPKTIGISEDYPEEYDIHDTKMTAEFQDYVNKHYQTLPCDIMKKLKP